MFLGTLEDAITWTLFGIGVGVLAVAVIVGTILAIIWVVNQFERVQSGEKFLQFHPGYEACCPPGLGCNEPKRAGAACFRMLAMQKANGEELDTLNQRWAAYNLKPSPGSLDAYADFRDMLISELLRVDGPKQLGMGIERIGQKDVEVEPLQKKRSTVEGFTYSDFDTDY